MKVEAEVFSYVRCYVCGGEEYFDTKISVENRYAEAMSEPHVSHYAFYSKLEGNYININGENVPFSSGPFAWSEKFYTNGAQVMLMKEAVQKFPTYTAKQPNGDLLRGTNLLLNSFVFPYNKSIYFARDNYYGRD